MDLQNALTHELGHLIGLDHTCFDPLTSMTGVRPDDNDGQPIPDCATASPDVQATTMFPSAQPGDTQKRTLAPDDRERRLHHLLRSTIRRRRRGPASTADATGCAAAGGPGDTGAAGDASALLAAVLIARRRRTRPATRGRR